MKLEIPKFLTTRPAFLSKRPAFLTRQPSRPTPPKKLHAATASRRTSQALDEDYDEEPTTRLSSAFFVVLILHVVAVGGIYAFNSIKAHRRGFEPATASAKAKSENATSPEAVAPVPVEREAAGETRPASAANLNAASQSAPQSSRTYEIKAGDNLTRIAASQGVTVAELQFVNSARELAVLRPGQTINVPARKTPVRPIVVEPPASSAPRISAPASGKTYEVKKGDTATSIAKQFGVTVDELLKLNKVSDPKKLQLGQALKLPSKKTN
jgi:LysM repeat protein